MINSVMQSVHPETAAKCRGDVFCGSCIQCQISTFRTATHYQIREMLTLQLMLAPWCSKTLKQPTSPTTHARIRGVKPALWRRNDSSGKNETLFIMSPNLTDQECLTDHRALAIIPSAEPHFPLVLLLLGLRTPHHCH